MPTDAEDSPARRGARKKKPSLKALESAFISKLKKSGFVENISSDEDLQFFSSDDESSDCDKEKPKLLHANEIVHGEEMFQFQTRKQRNSLAQKVAEVCNLKTPYKIRNKVRRNLAAKIMEEDSGSEFNVLTSEESSSEEIEEESNESDSDQLQCKQKSRKTVNDIKMNLTKCSRDRKPNSSKYMIKSDEYFSNCSAAKNRTSNNTLDKLETPRLPQYQLQNLLANMKLSKPHEKAINSLNQETNKNCFKKWLYVLNENFNILLYGLGSKKNILTNFHNEYLKELPVIVINGFFPSLSIKNILDGIIIELLELKENPSNVFECCDIIEQEFNYMPDTHLYLIIHNIEGEMLRNGKAQSVLSRLSSIKNIHLIASIDHINAPLIWDQNKLSKFNFIWWDVTSFLPYMEETSFERSMMVQQTGNLALSSLRNVFLSLTVNSKNIFMIIVKYQLENGKNQYYQGLPFKDLYMACRESFIVSSDLALRAQLTEFVDHKMVKLKRSDDGTENVTIPLGVQLLQKFLDEQS